MIRLISLLAACSFWPAGAETIVVGADAKTTRTVPGGFFGYNDQSAMSLNRQDPDLLNAISKVRAQVMRFPGGQNGNYWDWQTGLPIGNYDTGITMHKDAHPRKLEDLKREAGLLHYTPVFMLNVLTDPQCKPPAGGLCQYTPSSPNLDYQLQMLQAAQKLGIPVKYVELGNEYYLSNGKFTGLGYTSVYPDPIKPGDPLASTVYARLATQWIAAIKKQFPHALVAAVGTTTSGKNARRNSWNRGLFPALQGADAITMHTYIRTAVPKGTKVFDEAAAETMLATPFSNWASIRQDIAAVPKSVPIWFTEYNLGDMSEPVWGTWAHGLLTATMTMLFLEEPRVVMMLKHDLISGGVFGEFFGPAKGFATSGGGKYTPPSNPPPTTPFGRTASNMTMDEIARAAASATKAQRLNFPGAPLLNGSGTPYPALYGWSFQAGAARRVVVLNLSNRPLTIDVNALRLGGASYDQISGAPFTYVTGGLSGSPSNLIEKKGALAGRTCALPAYSVTRIYSGGAKSGH
jgi:hypothetical protein